MAKSRHLVISRKKIPDPNFFGHMAWDMLDGL